MMNPNSTAARYTETGAERLVRMTSLMKQEREDAKRQDLLLLAKEGKISVQAAGFATILSQAGVLMGQSSKLAHTFWELLGAYAM